MRKLSAFVIAVSVLLCLSALFTSCGEDTPVDIELIDLADYILSEVDLADFIEIPESKMQNDYNINNENTVQAIIMISLDMNSSEEIILIEATDKDTAKEIIDTLEKRKVEVLKTLKDYDANPNHEAQYNIVDHARMVTRDNYIFWAIHSENSAINNMIDEFIENNNK